MRKVIVAATQMSCTGSRSDNILKAEKIVCDAANGGAQIILLQELFETNYFCQKPREEYLTLATGLQDNPAICHFTKIAKELKVVLPICFFERCNNAFYNTIAVLDADGSMLGHYRKTHIPDDVGYQEKFYFNPGDTGFKVWDTAYGRIGCGICWDQWFPESARIMALMGAELILYPTAIGSSPADPSQHSCKQWQTCMQGHAAANFTPVIASNRIGTETEQDLNITFYGSSFIADGSGQILSQADDKTEGYVMAEFDLDALALRRRSWGVFRDRRPSMYTPLLTLDGCTNSLNSGCLYRE